MKIQCPKCGQKYDVDDGFAGKSVSCGCGESFFVPGNASFPSEPKEKPRSCKAISIRLIGKRVSIDTALFFAVVCLLLATVIHSLFESWFQIYVPLYLACFILSIVAIAQSCVIAGTLVLLCCFYLPILISSSKNSISEIARDQMIRGINEEDKINQAKLKAFAEEMSKPDKPSEPENKAPTLDGMFGIKFGEEFKPNTNSNNSKLTSGEVLYSFRPQKPFRNLDQYYVLITPKTHLVYEIWAEKTFDDPVKASDESNVLKSIIEEHYKVSEDRSNISITNYQYQFKNATIFLDRGVMSYTVKLRAIDNKLEEQAENERISIEKSKTDTSSL